MKTALIADDYPLIRATVRWLLEQEQVEVVAEAGDGVEAVRLAVELEPDLIVLDINMPTMNGLEALDRITALALKSRVIMLASQDTNLYPDHCMNAGAAAYVSKEGGLSELSMAIKLVMSGYKVFPESVNLKPHVSDVLQSDQARIKKLSDRELSILQQLARGMSNKQISQMMDLSSRTVSTYKTRLYGKLQVKSVVHLAEFARCNNLA